MELRTLAYAEAIARLGSFTAAAAEAHVAQPAVSAQIAALEREIGTALFVRAHRSVRLTEAGERVVARARRALAEVAAIRTDLDGLAGVMSGRLRIGATPLLGALDLPAGVALFQSRHPGVLLSLTTGLADALLHRLGTGELDLVIGPIRAELAPWVEASAIAPESVILIRPPGERRRIRALSDVADRCFVCLDRGSGLRAIVDRACADAGFAADVRIEAATPYQIPASSSAPARESRCSPNPSPGATGRR